MMELPQLELESVVTLGSAELRETYGVLHAAFSTDGQRMITVLRSDNIGVWDTTSGVLLAELPVSVFKARCSLPPDVDEEKVYPHKLALNCDGTLAIVGMKSDDVFLVDVEQGSILHSYQRPPMKYEDKYRINHYSRTQGWSQQGVEQVTFSPDDVFVAIVYDHQLVGVWHVNDGSLLTTLQPMSGVVSPSSMSWGLSSTVAISRDNRYLFLSTVDGIANIWDLSTGDHLLDGSHYLDEVISIDEVGGRLRWATTAGRIWETTDVSVARCILDTGTPWLRALFTLDGQYVVVYINSRKREGELHAYKLPFTTSSVDEYSPLIQHMEKHRRDGKVRSNFFIVFPREYDQSIDIWDGSIKTQWGEEGEAFVGIFYADPQQQMMAQIGEKGKEIRIWAVHSLSLLQTLRLDEPCQAVAFSPDGSKLAVRMASRNTSDPSYSITVSIWDTHTWVREHLVSLPGDRYGLDTFSFSADSHQLIMSYNTELIWWNLADETDGMPKLKKRSIPGTKCIMLSDGRFVVMPMDKLTHIYDVNAVPALTLQTAESIGYPFYVPMCISHDERSIFIASLRNVGKLWEWGGSHPLYHNVEQWSLETGELLQTFTIHSPSPQHLPAIPLIDLANFTPNDLWDGPGGPYITGLLMGSHVTPSFGLSADKRYAVVPYSHEIVLNADGAVLFDLHQDPPRPVAKLQFEGELVVQRFTEDAVLLMNVRGQIFRSRLPVER